MKVICVLQEPNGPMQDLLDVLRGWRVELETFRDISPAQLVESPAWRSAQLAFFDCPGPYPLLEAIAEPSGPRKILLHHGPSELPETLDLPRVADFAVSTSHAGRERLIAVGFTPQRVAVLPRPVETERFTPGLKDRALVSSLGLSEHFVLLQAGADGLAQALASLARLCAAGLPVKLLVIGSEQDPLDPTRVAAAAQRRGLSAQVSLIAAVSAQELPQVLRLGDICLGTIPDGNPLLLEAMACGKPVVTQHNGALAELIERGGRVSENPAVEIEALLRSVGAPPRAPKRPRLCFVNHRYGEGFAGGAEKLCRVMAENCQAAGMRVQVVTTTASSTLHWANDLPAGDEVIGGVPVKRFRIDPEAVDAFSRIHYQIDITRRTVSLADQQRWINTGVVEPALYQWLADHHDDFDFFIFMPYMPFVFNLRALRHPELLEKAIAVPCLHDENPARTPVMREMLESLYAVIFNSPGERELALSRLQLGTPNSFTLGVGLDTDRHGDAAAFRAAYQLDGPFITYCGRMEHGKNVPLLVDYFNQYKRARPGPLKLVLIGSGEAPCGDDVIPLGFVSEQDKLDCMAAALALVNPSVNESFSIVIMESWLQARPVLVHRGCQVTRDHVQESGGGLCFEQGAQFGAALDLLLAEPSIGDRMGRQGKAYVESRYTHPVLAARFREILDLLGSASDYERLALRAISRGRQFSRLRTVEAWERFLQRVGALSP